ncbi:acetyl-CoA C-acyltransferase [Rhodobacteraceae bacterium NNCM2]|nr:acetyl-CoA C-acyltransferase [Coraliihabitans acroporae]
MQDPIVIVGAARTPMGGFQGELSGAAAAELGAVAIKAALERAGVEATDVDELLMGCVLPAGQGQAPARQAGFGAGLPKEVPATTLNKMCGSGMKTVMVAHDQLLAGNGKVVVAGGMESMTNAPYIVPKMRGGARLGHAQMMDHMFLDGLEDAYDKGRLMGTFAEDCAEKYQFTREAQDEYALASLDGALKAQNEGRFKTEIAPVTIKTRKGTVEVTDDEQPRNARPDKIPQLKPAFKPDGTVTPANASSISDGAAALVMMRESEARERGLPIRARILGHASNAQEPGWFTTAPIPAMKRVMDKTGWSVEDVDLWEINEAFAVVPMAAMREMGIPRDKLNVNGGACALGHPIGASGARILVTLLHEMENRDVKRGIASLCIGGGEGTAVAIERI